MQRDKRTGGYEAPAVVDVEELVGLLSGGFGSGPFSVSDDGGSD